jgi:hypothetical protein
MPQFPFRWGLAAIAVGVTAGPVYYFCVFLPEQRKEVVQGYRDCLRRADSEFEQAMKHACQKRDEFYAACIEEGAPKRYCDKHYMGSEWSDGCKLPQKFSRPVRQEHQFAINKCLGELKGGVVPETVKIILP